MKKTAIIIISICLLVSFSACNLPIPGIAVAPNEPVLPEKLPTVYFVNSDKSADLLWQELASEYTAEKGIDVKVVTVDGDYDSFLASELEKRNPPTIFSVSDKASALKFEDYCMELDGQAVLSNQITDVFNFIASNGATTAIGINFSASGVAVNEELLEAAGYTLADVNDFTSMKAVAGDIHEKSEELGFDAFSPALFIKDDCTEILGNILNAIIYYQAKSEKSIPDILSDDTLSKLKNIVDLININSADSSENPKNALADFLSAKAVFYLCNAENYKELEKIKAVLLPIYCGADTEGNAAPSCKGGSAIAVNNEAEPGDVDAAFDFISWVVSSEAGIKALKSYYGLTVFKDIRDNNLFYDQICQYITEGKYLMTFSFDNSSKADFIDATADALMKYFNEETEWNDTANTIKSAWAKSDS